MNTDQIRGRLEVVLGVLLELGGRILRNDALAAQGKRERLLGGACADYGDAKSKFLKRVYRPGS
jgi:uncharacterized protein YjbJ (UPF0337 family)